VGTRAAEIKAVDRHAVLRRAANWPNEQKLVERQLTVMPVPTGNVKLTLNISRCQQLARCNSLRDIRRIALDDPYRGCLKFLLC